MTKNWYTISIDRYPENNGQLSVVEYQKQIPFSVHRIFWLSEIKGYDTIRGAHAHQDLQQVLYCVQGECEIQLEEAQGTNETIILSSRGNALFVNGPVWRTMTKFSPDCCLMVLCDRIYAEDTVIRDYEEFLLI